MRVRKPGKILDNLWFLGCEASCVYLLEGKRESMLINGGLSCIVPDLLAQFEEFGIDESRITKILLLHSHFDHIGVAPYLKRRNPGLDIYASVRASEVLRKSKVVQNINDASQYAMKSCGRSEDCAGFDLVWQKGLELLEVKEGSRIDLGEMEIEIFETPGHSPCSICAYLPDVKVIFPSDAAGLPLRDKLVIYATSNFSAYERSLEKIKHLQVQYVCLDHYGYVCGDEAAGFIQASIKAAKERKELIVATYARIGDVAETTRQIAAHFQDENKFDMVPYDVFVAAHRSMVMNIVDK